MLATQCVMQQRPQTLEARFEGPAGAGVTAKDLILAFIGQIGTAGARGCVIEYTGPAIRALSMEGRMTVCNMSIEAGARAGMIAPDRTTLEWLGGRPGAPGGSAWERAEVSWPALATDVGAAYDRSVILDISRVAPQVT